MAWQLEDMKFQKIIPLGGKNFAYVFADDKRSVAVVAPAQQGAAFTLPRREDWKVVDILGNLAASDTIQGNLLFYIESTQEPSAFAEDLAKLSETNAP